MEAQKFGKFAGQTLLLQFIHVQLPLIERKFAQPIAEQRSPNPAGPTGGQRFIGQPMHWHRPRALRVKPAQPLARQILLNATVPNG